MNPTDTNLWWGHSLADLDRLARISAVRAYGGRILDPTDRYETAWGVIVEVLATAATPPSPRDLVIAGASAVRDAGQDHRHTWGMGNTWGAVLRSTPNFQRYWELSRRNTPSPEDAVVDRQALAQIWPTLTTRHQQVLWALALHDGDHRAAAASLGYGLATYRNHLSDARAEYRGWWHQGERPSPVWGRSGTKGTITAARALTARLRARERRTAAA